MCSLHYGFVWISEPMVGTLFVQLCLKTVLSAHYQAFVRYIFFIGSFIGLILINKLLLSTCIILLLSKIPNGVNTISNSCKKALYLR